MFEAAPPVKKPKRRLPVRQLEGVESPATVMLIPIQMEDDIAAIHTANCIGCGLCVSTCPTESISMIHKGPDALSHVYANDSELIQAIAKDTHKSFPFE